VGATITIISTKADDPDSFEEMTLLERGTNSSGFKMFPVRSGRAIDTFLMAATKSDFGVFESSEVLKDKEGRKVHSNMIARASMPGVIKDLERLVEKKPDKTAKALVAHAKGKSDLARVLAALESDEWPEGGDPAEEAAAFAHHLLNAARDAKQYLNGVVWEFRGTIVI
jgi:hypothetical protein